MNLQIFNSKQALMEAFCLQNDKPVKYATADCTGAKYRPHQYRGGWVIPGFGYEISRIDTSNVTNENSGDPALACAWEETSDPISKLANWNPHVKVIKWGGENSVDHGSMWQDGELVKEW